MVRRMLARVSSSFWEVSRGSPDSGRGAMVGFWESFEPTCRNAPGSNTLVAGLKTSPERYMKMPAARSAPPRRPVSTILFAVLASGNAAMTRLRPCTSPGASQ